MHTRAVKPDIISPETEKRWVSLRISQTEVVWKYCDFSVNP